MFAPSKFPSSLTPQNRIKFSACWAGNLMQFGVPGEGSTRASRIWAGVQT